MRIFYSIYFFFLFVLSLALAKPGLGQGHIQVLDRPINLSVSDTSIEEVLEEISRQTGVNFSYSTHILPIHEKVSLSVTSQTLAQVLNTLFLERNVSYTVTGNRVVIRRKKAALTQTIRGTVIDHASKAPIIGANIFVIGTEPIKGSSSDEKGNFQIEDVPIGRQSLKVSHVSYQTLELPELLIGTGKENILIIHLKELISTMGEVVVTDEAVRMSPLNEMAAVSTRLLPMTIAKRQASTLQDPARIVSGYAGVTGDDYLENSIVIRGNSSRGLLWRLEGVEIPNPNHFADEGSASGGVSIMSANVLADSDFITSAFPARYGNALSGVLDLRLRNGNSEKQEYTIQAGTMGLDLAVEGPFKKGLKASYLINYRYSLFSLLNGTSFAIKTKNQATRFQDATFKIYIPTPRIGVISIFGTGGLSSFATDSVTTIGENQSDVGILGITHQFQFNASTSMQTVLSLSGTRIGQYRQFSAVDTDSSYQYAEEDFSKGYVRASVLLYKKWEATHLLEAGVTFSQLSYNFKDEYRPENISGESNSLFDDKGKAGTIQSHLSWRYQLGDKWTFITGIHALYFGLNRRSSFEPRTGISWQFHPKHSLHGGIGAHSRIEPLQYYFARFQLPGQDKIQYNRNLDFTKARHYVLGYNYQPYRDLLLRAEVYYQDLYKVAVRDDSSDIFSAISVYEGFTNYALANKGSGTNYGLEFAIEKNFSRNYYFNWNASLYRATYQTLDQVKRNTPYNGSFTTHLLAGREFMFGKRQGQHQFNLNCRVVWNGGKRYVPIDLEASIQKGRQVLDLSEAYNNRMNNYFRLDIQAAYRLNVKWFTGELRLDILNVTNHMAPMRHYYNIQTQQIATYHQSGLYPVITCRMEF